MSRDLEPYSLRMPAARPHSEHDEILKTVQLYIDACKQGKSDLMRPAFHSQASFFGYAGDQLAVGTEFLFDWIKTGASSEVNISFVVNPKTNEILGLTTDKGTVMSCELKRMSNGRGSDK